MTAADRPVLVLGQMAWTELDALRDEIELVLLPIGSTEQHGPHLGLGTDHLLTQAFCDLAAERMHPRVLSLPAIPWGISDHHMNFAGSMTLRAETFLALIEDVIGSMRAHGFRRFLIVNGHGGNRPLMTAAVHDFGLRLDIDFLGSLTHSSLGEPGIEDFPERPTHACEVEVSQAYYLHPALVREGAQVPGKIDGAFQRLADGLEAQELVWRYAFDAKTANGALGDARRGSREAGERAVQAALDELEEIIGYLREAGLRWNGPPHGELHVRGPAAN